MLGRLTASMYSKSEYDYGINCILKEALLKIDIYAVKYYVNNLLDTIIEDMHFV